MSINKHWSEIFCFKCLPLLDKFKTYSFITHPPSPLTVKHLKNWECCPCHSLFKGHKVILNNVVLNCQQCNQCLKCQVSGHKISKNLTSIVDEIFLSTIVDENFLSTKCMRADMPMKSLRSLRSLLRSLRSSLRSWVSEIHGGNPTICWGHKSPKVQVSQSGPSQIFQPLNSISTMHEQWYHPAREWHCHL